MSSGYNSAIDEEAGLVRTKQNRIAQRKPVATEGFEEQSIEWLSRKLCTRQEMKLYTKRQAYYQSKPSNKVLLFPIWQRYRHQAIRIIRLRRSWPWLRYFPLRVSATLVNWVYPALSR